MVNREELLYIAGQTIHTLRSERGMSIKELANKSELDKKHLEEIEQGKREPNASDIYDKALALEIEVPEIYLIIQRKLKENEQPGGKKMNDQDLRREHSAIIGNNIRKNRMKKGLSIQQLADLSCLIEDKLKNIEEGISELEVYDGSLIARALNVSIDEIVPGRGDEVIEKMYEDAERTKKKY
ncbi:helix-turn-helix domain-containing protein [Bacillus shivajii]|uniref:helix-turn-helix domain-containing protein n=1 Tax=Bacillus shivajii TaxID=1983719 RepID=UPI001CFB7382|nr:helix-turn-helix transcriptional regulator [Bacillus shivajii]UCZ52830.1 helix-turn-helix domain-containing protein [Bacillus shivajii]